MAIRAKAPFFSAKSILRRYEALQPDKKYLLYPENNSGVI
jgi:hypothetical protein